MTLLADDNRLRTQEDEQHKGIWGRSCFLSLPGCQTRFSCDSQREIGEGFDLLKLCVGETE
jgi:hypothetical protein